jgi:hypothetical protein
MSHTERFRMRLKGCIFRVKKQLFGKGCRNTKTDSLLYIIVSREEKMGSLFSGKGWQGWKREDFFGSSIVMKKK